MLEGMRTQSMSNVTSATCLPYFLTVIKEHIFVRKYFSKYLTNRQKIEFIPDTPLEKKTKKEAS